MGGVLFSTSEEGFDAAVQELREVFGRDVAVERAGPDAGVLTGPAVAEVAEACRGARIAFVRHLAEVAARLPASAGVAEVRDAALDLVDGPALAVQVWASGSAGLASGDVAGAVRDALVERGVDVARSGRPRVLSACLTAGGVLLGVTPLAHALSDWPGGRVRLAKREGQVSRAEFKLEELFTAHPLALPASGRALDLGAAPGGWTRVLRLRGLRVWAVDPAELDPRVAADPGVHHVRTTAGEFFRSGPGRFDLVANDMRMDPELSCRFVLDAAAHLRPGAPAVVTLKTGTHRPLAALRRCRALLNAEYETVFARQLYHNRHELTVVAQRRCSR